MKRCLSFVMAMLLLLGSVSVLSACKKEKVGVATLSRKTVEADLSGYTIVYGGSQGKGDYTATFRDKLNELSAGVSAVTGSKIPVYTEDRTKTGAADKEILVGNTVRAESAEALASIKGEGFKIQVTDNKVVLVGTSNVLTLMALNLFIEQYLQDAKEGEALVLNQTVTANNVEMLTLATNTEATYTYVHKDGMGTYPPAFAGTNHASATKTYQEYAQISITNIVDKMKSITGLRDKYYPVKTDKESFDKQVLVGPVESEAGKAVLQTIAENEFIIATEGEHVVVNGWNELGLSVAAGRYLDILSEATVYNEDGSVRVELPRGFRLTGVVNEDWVLDFPRPDTDGLTLYNTMDANDGGLQFLYMGEGATADAHKAYCDKLLGEGYTVYTENEIEESLFTTLVNEEANVMLYVAYNAYAHVEEYDNEYSWTASKVKTGDFGYYEYDRCLRIVSAPLDTSCLVEEKLLSPQSYTKVTDSAITTMPLYDMAVGLIYVITLEDGSFVVFDGGNVNDGGTEYDALWKAMEGMYSEINGGAKPSRQSPIRIAAWIMTHAHVDHYTAFEKMAQKYGSTGKLVMDYMIANVPAEHSAWPVHGEANCMDPERIASMQRMIPGGFTYIKVHTGQKFYLANLEIEVLATWEDLNPWVINDGNETNTVLRFTMSNKDGGTPVTQLWTGDAQRWLSRYLCAMYGSYLESDMVSVGHHGNVGCEIDLYDTVKATTVWWPHNAKAVRNYLKPTNVNVGFQYEVDQYLCNNISSVRYIFASGQIDGVAGQNNYTTLKFTVNGPDYDNIYDLMTGEKLEYSSYDSNGNGVSSCMKKY